MRLLLTLMSLDRQTRSTGKGSRAGDGRGRFQLELAGRATTSKELIEAMIAKAGEISQQAGHWWADQLRNEDGADGYAELGEEIWSQAGGEVDAVVHTVSTAHSIHGMSRALRRHRPDLPVFAVEPAESAVGKPPGSHKIEGIGLGFIPPLWHPEEVTEILTVSTDDAKAMARRLARDESLPARRQARTSLRRCVLPSVSDPARQSRQSSSIQACATSARTSSGQSGSNRGPLASDAHRHSPIDSQHLAGDEVVANHIERRLGDGLGGSFAP